VIQTVISHYRLLSLLGEGGMGVVYRAEDLRLGREVAVKVLRTDEADQRSWLARFEREARLASSLQHPHICTIHELGEHEGRPFIVMELLEGRTIKQMLESGPLPIDRLLELSVQTATALEAAHGRDIIHRDIKPANLFVTHGDRVKVLDFGLAKVAGSLKPSVAVTGEGMPAGLLGGPDVTSTGMTVGTAAYMSPEQAAGTGVDARTDLFSFGSVLYEMATGRRAFPGESTPVVLLRLRAGDVVPVRTLNPAIPDRLEKIIHRALEVDVARRYQTAAEIAGDLRALARQLTPEASATAVVEPVNTATGAPVAPATHPRRIAWIRVAPASHPRRSASIRVPGLAVGGVILLLSLFALSRWGTFGSRPAALSDRDSILIATFANNTDDPVFDETLTTALKVQLGQSPFLDIVSDDRIAETLRLMGRTAEDRLTHLVAREVCQRLGVKAMLEGGVSRLGSNYVVTLSATDCQSGSTVGREQGEATSKEQVLNTLGSISSSIRTTLGESLPSIQRFDVPIEQATTPSLAALKAYALGLAERQRGRELESIAFFNQAIELDPEFAAAYTTLSTVYGSLGEWRRSEEYAQLAYARQARVSERERLFITYQFHDRVTGDQVRAGQALEVWKLSYPRDSRPANALALIHNRFGRYNQAAAEAQEALRRSPGHPFPMSNLAVAHRGLGRYQEARKVAEEAVALGVATTPTRRLLYQLGVLANDGSAARQLEWAKDRPREFDLISAQAQVAAFQGRLREAAALYQQAADKALARGLSGTAFGYRAHLAWTESLYGDPARLATRVRQLLERTEEAGEEPGTVPRFRAAAALGLVGLEANARDMLARAQQRYPNSTFVRTVLVPSTVAAIAIDRRRPTEAIGALEPAGPTELGTLAGLVPPYLRAEAYLAQAAAASARREYQKVLDHRGADPFAPVVPLAHLGLARAWAVEHDLQKSRQKYEELFGLWENADADLPILQRARAEYARLSSR
jgi:serine/threonine protein kinase/tetratricopeptide (TPR) repeat protein